MTMNCIEYQTYESSAQFGENSSVNYDSSLFQNACFNISTDNFTNIPAEISSVNMTNLISYSVLFPFAAIGNLLVFVALFKNRHRKSRVNLMLLHLSIADMIVTFVFLPTEIIWHINIQWVFGNAGCKIYKYLSAFGFYISSMVLVCISLDRYFAVLHPLKVNDAQRRGKIMLFFAWLISAVISLPQSVIFNVQSHPLVPSFRQCVTFGFFDANEEMIYTAFVISFLYFIPLTIIIIAYTTIIIEITKKSREASSDDQGTATGGSRKPLRLRRSNVSTIERARSRTLGMTFIIVMAFVWCWTPYSICTLWNFIDQDSFRNMNEHLQDIVFILAVSNSVVNPIIYGRYSISCFRKRKTIRKFPLSTAAPEPSENMYYWCCCCCCLLSPISLAESCRSHKLCNGSILTRTTGTINNKFRMEPIQGHALNQIKILDATQPEFVEAPELISMMPLGLQNNPVNLPSGEDSFTYNCAISSPHSCMRDPLSTFEQDHSSGYSSSQGQCQSYQDVHEPERLRTVWEAHHSC